MARQLQEFLTGLENEAEILKIIKKNMRDDNCKLFIDDGEENVYVPKARLDSKISQLNKANEKINELNETIADLEGDPKNGDAVKLKEQLEAKDKEIQELKIGNSLDLLAQEAGAHDVNDLKAFLDMEKVTINDKGEIEGLKDQIEALKTSKAYLFTEEQPTDPGNPQPFPFMGGTGAPGKQGKDFVWGSKTQHEGDFGKMLSQQNTPQAGEKVINSDYFFNK